MSRKDLHLMDSNFPIHPMAMIKLAMTTNIQHLYSFPKNMNDLHQTLNQFSIQPLYYMWSIHLLH